MKKILYVDMDNVLVDFPSGISKISKQLQSEYEDRLDEVPGIFSLMDPLKGAIESYRKLSQKFDTYILSTAPWKNSSGWSDKNEWVKKYLGDVAYKRLILRSKNFVNVHKISTFRYQKIDFRCLKWSRMIPGTK